MKLIDSNIKKNSIVIGIVGGIGSGKTLVTKLIEEHWNSSTIIADHIGHDIILKGNIAYDMIVQEFGKDILNEDGEINRGKLGKIVFTDYNALQKLNLITHPIMYKIIESKINQLKSENKQIIVLEAAVMIEAKFTDFIDSLWLVKCDLNKRIERLVNFRGFNKNTALARIKSQKSDNKFARYADVIIDNSFDIQNTKNQIDNEIRKLLSNKIGGNEYEKN